MSRGPGCPFGSHRAGGALPQAAARLDASPEIWDNELRIRVERLNLDSSSMRQIAEACGGDPDRVRARIGEIVKSRGKMHNPVTGSGGMLIGRVREIGAAHPAKEALKPGDRIATLVSLTLTPLKLEQILAVHKETERIDVKGYALLFATGIYAKLDLGALEQVALPWPGGAQ